MSADLLGSPSYLPVVRVEDRGWGIRRYSGVGELAPATVTGG
ncbi:hypothetical protein [Streptomyces hydrogenans]